MWDNSLQEIVWFDWSNVNSQNLKKKKLAITFTDVWALVIFKMLRIILAAFLHRALIYVTVESAFIEKCDLTSTCRIHRLYMSIQLHVPSRRLESLRSSHSNNDLEGWHNALNRRDGGRVHKPFYLLIQQKEAVQVRLVSDENWEGSREESFAPFWPRSMIYGMSRHQMRQDSRSAVEVYIIHEEECFIRYPNTEKRVQKRRCRWVFSSTNVEASQSLSKHW